MDNYRKTLFDYAKEKKYINEDQIDESFGVQILKDNYYDNRSFRRLENFIKKNYSKEELINENYKRN